MSLDPLNQAFEEAIRVTPLSSHEYLAHLRDEWCIGTVPHGGYTTAVLYRLATSHFAYTHPSRYDAPATPISIQLAFLRRTAAGPAILSVEDAKIGARTSTIRVTLSQTRENKGANGEKKEELEVKVTGFITVSPATAEVGVNYNTGWSVNPPVHPGTGAEGRVNLEKLGRTGKDGEWKKIIAAFLDFRRATKQIEMFGPEPKTAAKKKVRVADQWARFRPGGDEKGRWTNEAVAYLVDMFPSALDELDMMSSEGMGLKREDKPADKKEMAKFWYPTVTLNIDFKKRLPVGGVEWLFSRIHTKVIRNGRTDINVEVVDEAGEVVALASQVGLVLSASRNVGTRSKL